MRNIWSDIAARERKIEAFAEHLELRLHTVAMVVTVIVLAMRLVAGTRDLATDSWSTEEPSQDAAAPYCYGL